MSGETRKGTGGRRIKEDGEEAGPVADQLSIPAVADGGRRNRRYNDELGPGQRNVEHGLSADYPQQRNGQRQQQRRTSSPRVSRGGSSSSSRSRSSSSSSRQNSMGGNWGGTSKSIKNLNSLSNSEKIQLAEEQDNVEVESMNVSPIRISYSVHARIRAIMEEIPRTEWSAMLDVNEHGVIDEIYFPEQVGHGGTVNDIEREETRGYPGILHSHHTMSLGFSGTDHKGINSNYDLSVLIGWEDSSRSSVEYREGSRRVHKDDEKIVKATTDVKVVDPSFTQETKQELKNTVDERFEKRTYNRRYGGAGKKSSKNSRQSSSRRSNNSDNDGDDDNNGGNGNMKLPLNERREIRGQKRANNNNENEDENESD